MKARLGLPPGPLVGFGGRIRAQKGVGVFVDAMLATMAEHGDVSAVIIGHTKLQHQKFSNTSKSKIEQAGMSHRFFWTDALPLADLPDHYTAFDVVYAPPRSEGFGLTPLEAMACEVPALATPVGPFDLQIEDGQTGRILPVGDAAGFSDALNDLLANPERRVAWGKAGRKRVEAQFDINRKAREIVDFNVIC